ncbi:unnamed protein product [Rodentolepis nana]|uniref:Outer membrane lipoprotein carrier protein LolA n=1 Tax=Rodentolepis nana TaxID=102285 RepID=A0A0R3TZT2_RODNA|nr:unnamed protein product [Rodentolepis nana]
MSILFFDNKKSAAIVKGRNEEGKRLKSQINNAGDLSFCIYKPSEDTIVWKPTIDGKEQSIALQKSSMNIWFEDERLDYNTTIDDHMVRMDFLLLGKKAVIINYSEPQGNKEGSFKLCIEGEEVPQMQLSSESDN